MESSRHHFSQDGRFTSPGAIHIWLLLILTITLQACSANDPSPIPKAETSTATTVTSTQTTQPPTSVPTTTPEPTPTILREPPPLPLPYQTSYLNPVDYPHTYFQDACQYLRVKWDPEKSAPGTVVMILMFHSINRDTTQTNPSAINANAFQKAMQTLKDQGFEAINMAEFVGFMETNEKIPARSVLLIADDRHFGQYFNTHFRPLYEQWGWPVINAWISHPDQTFNPATGLGVWEENERLAPEGWIDFQAHGVLHQPILNSSSDDFINTELTGPISFIQEHFGSAPIAYIWAGGNFTERSVQLARQHGYRVGFTVNPRGPVMFNWVPLADADDPQRPSYLSEGNVNDPLMVLPRYWPSQIISEVDTVRVIGKEAAAYAEQNRATELEYYEIVCEPSLGAIPNLAD